MTDATKRRWMEPDAECHTPGAGDNATSTCSIEGCEKRTHARGWCDAHYQRFLKWGSPSGGGSPRDRRPWQERIATGYRVTASGCWEWSGSIDSDGYGVLRVSGRRMAAHRASFRIYTGRSDFGALDHACRNRACVNPAHLREASHALNAENLAARKNSRSGHRGVAWHEPSKSWHVTAGKNGRQHSGGYFKDVESAARAAVELRNSLYTYNEEDRWARN